VKLEGFEPPTPSLRKMWSRRCDLGKRHPFMVLWGGCGVSDVRHRELWCDPVSPELIAKTLTGGDLPGRWVLGSRSDLVSSLRARERLVI
jgi:hypothetical protein